MRPVASFGAVAVAVAVDRIAADPPDRWHPVAWFGRAMVRVERHIWRDRRSAGVVYATIGVAGAACIGVIVQEAFGRPARRHGVATVTFSAATLVAATLALGGGGLDRAAGAVQTALQVGDLDEARRLLPWLVGRDPSGLSPEEIARAVVESVAENTVDAVVAPALYGGLLGPPGVLAHRAANTLDAMVGYRSARYARFGWASARLDDALNFAPARLAVVLVAALRPHRAANVWRIVKRDADRHPSPNAGVVEAAFAAALAIRLGGTNRYGHTIERRATLGDGPRPAADDIARARRLAGEVGAATAATSAITALVIARLGRRGAARATVAR